MLPSLQKTALILMFALLAGGCGSFIKLQAWPAPYSIAAGSKISINQDLTVPPEAVSVWLQFGKIVDRRNIRVRYPNCHFELYTLKHEEQTIFKDEVTITKFVHSNDYVSNNNNTFASLADFSDSGGPMAEIFTTEIYLKSEKQPDLYRLVCEHWEDPSSGIFLTMDQIREALGDIATIEPK